LSFAAKSWQLVTAHGTSLGPCGTQNGDASFQNLGCFSQEGPSSAFRLE
jgi:hypothetical protein